MRVRVELTPSAPETALRGWPRRPRLWAGVAIDVVRASTTLAFALRNGAARIVPAATVEEALAWRNRAPRALLCGERDARRIPGFDLGNSPAEYTEGVVRGRTLVFASTNGSLALRRIARCGSRLCGAFVNGSAVARALVGRPYVLLVCAGKLGRFALEDAVFAGWLCERLAAAGATIEGAGAALARALAPADAREARALVQGSEHGRYLRSLGSAYAADVDLCARLDLIERAFEV
jgi:2-phosphosulfolactate phosphatase